MRYIEKHKLALSLGASYVLGYWQFPSPALKQKFDRIVAGLEWSPAQLVKADAALAQHREAFSEAS